MRVYQVKRFPIYDIFTGDGWENWSRVLVSKDKRVTTLAGTQSPHVDIKTVLELALQSRNQHSKVAR
jgi:hypothetical protein